MRKSYRCPSCGYPRSWVVRRSHRTCKRCRTEWSPGNRQLVPGFHADKKSWQKIIATFLAERTIDAVSKECGLSKNTAWRHVRAIRLVMTEDVPVSFSGTCEADATFVGGAFSNKHIHIRKQGSKRGRGTQKQAIFGVLCRDMNMVRVVLVSKEERRVVIPIIRNLVTKGSTVFTDGLVGYRLLPKYGYRHAWVDHMAGEYVRGEVHTQTLDGFWGHLKNRLAMQGGIRKAYLPFFIGEHVWRYNFRHLSREKQIERILEFLK